MSLRTFTATLLLTAIALPLHAQDAHSGKELTDQNCYQCHGNEVYTRSNRKVTSMDGLQKQVRFCEQALGLTWFDEQINAVAGYLNQEFYKFK